MKNSKVQELLSNAVGVKPKVKTSFNLDKGFYEQFKKLCDLKGISQSSVMDALLEDFLRGVEKPPQAEKVKRTKPAGKPAGKGYQDLPGEIRI